MSNVCADCIGDHFLHEQIMQSGEVACCDFCQSVENPTIGLDELAEQVHSVLDEHFSPPDPEGVDSLGAQKGYWEQPGEPVTYAIMNLIDSTDDLAEAIREHLSDLHDPRGKDAIFEFSPYANDSHYEERPIDTYEFKESWVSFRREILSRSRFFNRAAKSALKHLFSGVEQLTTYDSGPVVRVFRSESSIIRARVANSHDDLEAILKDAPSSLGAPPGHFARAGRMNAEGISVFYGATDVDTCIAEIRAPVGSYVVSGKFTPLRELRILDLTRLRRVFLQGSLFDPAHGEALSRVHFLKRLESELSQPVMPGAESRDYIPTQVVAEYLGSHPDMKLDGVMFASSQISSPEGTDTTSEEQHAGKNFVLFSHATGLGHYDIPDGTEIEVGQSFGDPDGPAYSIWITENVPNSAEQEEKVAERHDGFDCLDYPCLPGSGEEKLDVSIRLDMESIEVRKIQGVSYQVFSISVSRHRSEVKDNDF